MSILIVSSKQKNTEEYLQNHISKVENVSINILNNVDIINCNKDNTKLSTMNVRSILNETSLKPHQLSSKYIIIYNYDRVGERIQNMLLKTLEEGRVKILLHANSIANILPTTLSRVIVHNLENNLNTSEENETIIHNIIVDKQVNRIWDVKKEDINDFLNCLETYLKSNKPDNYEKVDKKIMLLKKRISTGITLNKDIQLTNLFLDLL